METVYYTGSVEEDGTRISFYKRLRKFVIHIRTCMFLAFMMLSSYIYTALHLIRWFWPISFLYICWTYYDRESRYFGLRGLSFMRKCIIWEGLRDYFPSKLVKTADLPADKRYLFATFPHGMMCFGVLCNILTDVNDFNKAYPGLKTHSATWTLMLYTPLFGDFLSWLGCCAASEKSIIRILNGEPGTVCIIMVGGIAEALQSFPGTNKIFLRNRKGFVRIALRTGASLVPVFSFGETNTYYQPQSKLYKTVQSIAKSKIDLPFVLMNGRGFFQDLIGILPRKRAITTVIGQPIEVPKIENPTEEMVDEYHKKFTAELEGLFNRYKGKYDENGEKSVLEIM